jgi:hypothetical protein
MTWLCELVEKEQEKQDDAGAGGPEKATAERRDEKNRNGRVANAVSKYCVHLVLSAPELFPGPVSETMKAHREFVGLQRRELLEDESTNLVAMSDPEFWIDLECNFSDLFDSDNLCLLRMWFCVAWVWQKSFSMTTLCYMEQHISMTPGRH